MQKWFSKRFSIGKNDPTGKSCHSLFCRILSGDAHFLFHFQTPYKVFLHKKSKKPITPELPHKLAFRHFSAYISTTHNNCDTCSLQFFACIPRTILTIQHGYHLQFMVPCVVYLFGFLLQCLPISLLQ